MSFIFNPTITSEGRVFINVDGPGCGNGFAYHNCMKVAALDKSFGDVTPIWCPNPDAYDDFVEVGTIKGANSRWTSSMSGKLPVSKLSPLEEIANQGCTFNIQVHYGKCSRPNDFSNFETAFIMRNARLTSYGLSELVALSPEERNAVDENASISVGEVYRIFNQTFSTPAQALLPANVPSAVVFCDNQSCGTDCDTRSTGCNIAIANVTGGNEFLVTEDGGQSWVSSPYNTAIGTSLKGGLACIGSDILHSDTLAGGSFMYRVPISSIIAGNAIPTTVFSGTTAQPIAEIVNADAYAFGAGGTAGAFIVAYNKNSGSSTILESASVLSTFPLSSIDAYDDDNVLAGGTTGRYMYSNSFGAFNAGQLSVNGVNLTANISSVHMINATNWLVSTNANQILCTSNSGASWSIAQSVSGPGRFGFYDDIVGYFLDTSGIYRTLDSGNSWTLIFSSVNLGANDISVCPYNPNLILSASGSNIFVGSGAITRGVA